MAMKLMKEWKRAATRWTSSSTGNTRARPYVDPHDEEKSRVQGPSQPLSLGLSRDFRRDQGEYKDYDNLFAMYLLYNLGKYKRARERGDEAPRNRQRGKLPLQYTQAAELPERSAKSDSHDFQRGVPFVPKGAPIGQSQ
jgi:hypothetical protein